MHVCETCLHGFLNFQFPKWLKAAAAALLAMLVLSLIHGQSYFVAGRAYYKGKKLLADHRAAEAVPYLVEALKAGGNSNELVETGAIAHLTAGQPDEAYKLVESRNFETDELFRSMKAEFERWTAAAKKAEEAERLYKDKNYKDAALRMKEAAAGYPAFAGF